MYHVANHARELDGAWVEAVVPKMPKWLELLRSSQLPASDPVQLMAVQTTGKIELVFGL